MTMIELTCTKCGKIFHRYKGEYTRQVNRGKTNFYCSLSCYGRNASNIKKLAEIRSGYDISKHAGNHADMYSPFRYFLNRIRNGSGKRYGVSDLDLPYLYQLYQEQNGQCKLSNVMMTLPQSTKDTRAELTDASLDRIDSTKGYTKGNVQFVCQFINMGKCSYTDEKVRDFIHKVKSV